jgi:uncharacterized protein with ParB-like and HNH nuclease domain
MDEQSININPRPYFIKTIFDSRVFVIPYYQRQYAWEESQCEMLWNDLYDQAAPYLGQVDIGEAPQYFLGSIFLASIDKDKKEDDAKKAKISNNNDSPFYVIDGQQRLITLSLLLRALWYEGNENDTFWKCLNRYDQDVTGKSVGFRFLFSNESLKQDLESILQTDNILIENQDEILDEKHDKTLTTYCKNFKFFRKKVERFKDKLDERKNFIKFILHHAYLLEIICPDEEKAITFFETINNRGLDLSDSDIFKAELAKLASKDNANNFAIQWKILEDKLEKLQDNINKKVSFTDLFRCYMHILRANANDTTQIVGLREFFNGKVKDASKNATTKNEYTFTSIGWSNVLDAIDRLISAISILYNTADIEFCVWRFTLISYQNNDWLYPVITFIYNKLEQYDKTNTEQNELNNGEQLTDSDLKECTQIMRNLVRYIYAKGSGITTSVGSAVSSEEFAKITAHIINQPQEYIPKIVLHQEARNLLDQAFTPKIRKGLCAIIEFTAGIDRIKSFENRIEKEKLSIKEVFEKIEVEHILPRQWTQHGDYKNDWKTEKDKKLAEERIDTLGNLMLLRSNVNRKISNNAFDLKIEKGYNISVFSEPHKVAKEYKKWTPKYYKDRHEYCKKILLDFFRDTSDAATTSAQENNQK